MTSPQANPGYQRIWETARLIPAGRVASYGQIADLAGLPGRARMVGKAFGAAPADMDVPWFRVLRADGRIAFPSGSQHARLQIEQLRAEGVRVENHRVRLRDFQWQPDLSELLFALKY